MAFVWRCGAAPLALREEGADRRVEPCQRGGFGGEALDCSLDAASRAAAFPPHRTPSAVLFQQPDAAINHFRQHFTAPLHLMVSSRCLRKAPITSWGVKRMGSFRVIAVILALILTMLALVCAVVPGSRLATPSESAGLMPFTAPAVAASWAVPPSA
jgi:hypothetical protein